MIPLSTGNADAHQDHHPQGHHPHHDHRHHARPPSRPPHHGHRPCDAAVRVLGAVPPRSTATRPTTACATDCGWPADDHELAARRLRRSATRTGPRRRNPSPEVARTCESGPLTADRDACIVPLASIRSGRSGGAPGERIHVDACGAGERGRRRRHVGCRTPRRRDEALRRRRRRRRRRPRHARGRVPLDARAVGLGQDDDAADDRRLRAADGRADRAPRRGRHRAGRRSTATSTPCSRTTRCSRT